VTRRRDILDRLNDPTLRDLAERINFSFSEVGKHEAGLYWARIAAGRDLIIARVKLAEDEPETAWEEWCKTNVSARSQRDIRRCMAMAKSDNPVAAHEEEKRKAREGMQKHRTNVSPLAPPHPNPEEWRRQADRVIGNGEPREPETQPTCRTVIARPAHPTPFQAAFFKMADAVFMHMRMHSDKPTSIDRLLVEFEETYVIGREIPQ
jgi:hypothetical protein